VDRDETRRQQEHNREHREAMRKTRDILDQAQERTAQARRDIPYDQEAWERYLQAEHRDLEWRRNGGLARAIGSPLPDESATELERIAQEDQLRAEEGLVELRYGGNVWYKHIDELLPKDRTYRAQAERARVDWLRARMEQQL
jgi:hypothetical protein